MGLITSDITISGSSTASLSLTNLPTASSLTNILVYNSASGIVSYTASSAIKIPGGSNTQVQYNAGGTFAGNSALTFIIASQSLQQGDQVTASGQCSHAEGYSSIALGPYSHAEGGAPSLASGRPGGTANGEGSHAEGIITIAEGTGSHAEGYGATSIGGFSHAEGNETQAIGDYSHAEGNSTQAVGIASHAEGNQTQAIGDYSHAEGNFTQAVGIASHAGGNSTIASGSYQIVVGSYNTQNNTESKFIVGIGDESTRKDGFTVDVDANLSGSIMIPTNIANPSNPKTGSMYFNPSTNRLHIYNGTAWRSSSFS